MIGPFPSGTYTNRQASNTGPAWEHLVKGSVYVVIREFADSDKQSHPVGESWIFLGYSHNRLDGGLSLFVSFDDRQEWHIPLEDSEEEQKSVLDYLKGFIVPAKE